MKYTYLLILSIFLTNCESPNVPNKSIAEAAISLDDTKDNKAEKKSELDTRYWYGGKAEITKYDLRQNRYREVHGGEVILIFVTEDFLTDKQVKNDRYVNKHSTSVLKTNQLRRFTTGLYDYSMMTSVFTRADGSATEKITVSAQDWCGQSFAQLNKKGDKYYIELRSYFESEGDQNVTIKADLLEDEVMNLIRIDPDLIPIGNVSLLPAMTYLRLSHQPMAAQAATISRSKTGSEQSQLTIHYPNERRTVTITYETAPPHKISSFKDSYPSAFDGEVRTTEAINKAEMHDAYWKMNHTNEAARRSELGISGFSS